MSRAYQGSMKKFLLKSIFTLLFSWLFYFLVEQTLIEFGDIHYDVYNKAFWITFPVVWIFLLLWHKSLVAEISSTRLAITKAFAKTASYDLDRIEVFLKTSLFHIHELTVFRRMVLMVRDKNGAILGKHNLSGLTAEQAALLYDELRVLTGGHAPPEEEYGTHSGETETDAVQSRTGYRKGFSAVMIPVDIDLRAVNRGIKRVCTIFSVLLLAAAVYDYTADGSEQMYLLYAIVAAPFLFFRIVIGLRKNPHAYPRTLTVGDVALKIDDESFPYANIQCIYYTPVMEERVYRTLTILFTDNRKYKRLLGLQLDNSRPEPEKFSDYPLFVQALRNRFSGEPGKIVEDVTLAHTDRKTR